MSGEQVQDTGNGELANAAAQAKSVDRPAIVKGGTYILMPTRTLTDVVKILRKLPYEDVELVMSDLKRVTPVKGKPAE